MRHRVVSAGRHAVVFALSSAAVVHVPGELLVRIDKRGHVINVSTCSLLIEFEIVCVCDLNKKSDVQKK